MQRLLSTDERLKAGLPPRAGVQRLALAWLKARWAFLAMVVAPTLAASVYLFAIASDQYVSEAHFLVRTPQPAAPKAASLGDLVGLGAGPSRTESDALSLTDYLVSHDALREADRRLGLAQVWRRPETDIFSRLHDERPAAETLLKYYRGHVSVGPNPDTGVITLKVRAFRPADAKLLADLLLQLGEQRVNALNRRAEAETMRVAEQEAARAEADLESIQGTLTEFRTAQADIDPQQTQNAQMGLSAAIQQQLVTARAQLAAMAPYIEPGAPQRVALSHRIAALESALAAQSARLTGAPQALAPDLAAYESLKLRQEFAAKRYAAAAAALASAREEATRQQLFVVRVVEPNLPQKALYPRRWTTLAGIFAALLLAYGIGWLLLAGVREHAG